MANSESDRNGSQFFITTAKTPWLNDKHTLFGKVVSGFDTVAAIEAIGSQSGRPHTSDGSWFSPTLIDLPVILSLQLKNLQEIVTQKE